MAVSNTTVRQKYTGNGATTSFAIPFSFTPGQASDVTKVYNIDSDTGELTLVSSANYTFSPGGLNPTNVVFTAAPTNGQEFLVTREVARTQIATYINDGPFLNEDHEKCLNRLTFLVQQLGLKLDNALVLNLLDQLAGASAEIPKLVANSVIAVDEDGLGFTMGPTTTAIVNAVSGQGKTTVGTRAVPTNVVAANGILFTSVTWETLNFVQGSGGAVVVSAAARIQAGTVVGQRLTLVGRSDANYIDLADGNGIVTGGQTIRLVANTIAVFIWDGTNWTLESTNGFLA